MNKLIELKGISYQRSNGQQCADALDFSLSKGDRVAITGSNGSGKSTLLQIILGLLQDVKGEVILFGNSCKSDKEFAKFRTRLGLVFQDPDDQLFSPTVIEDVCFGPINQGYNQKEAEEMSMKTLKDLGIEHLAHSVSYRLSGGQKRLAALASVLVMKPEVLLLDEPTNGLDDKNYQLFIDIVNRVNLPIILVSHDEKLRKTLTDTEYRLHEGKLILEQQPA
ncbi:energy-coupling factor ABC transporter ATP-binding protein [Vibrio sp. JC009]|uniref:energy-coupling factor ABC transporter ATP-binding protein n=1 Tax=Vibrio sp. JC009 TaxID=2912314 RepID=UPI0023B126FA|nr:ABC transporter ATP-binding protein [Vibrio sp. JC009]WED22838.1 energy-coupling factor ABC transporter ATP-binding protein [Vibrio sp. JC009]